MGKKFKEEVTQGERFQFGENWEDFLNTLTDERIFEAEKSLKKMLGVDDLQGSYFLDIGSGSGLFSLAASRLGAKVHSFDYDLNSVKCTEELWKRYFSNDNEWVIESGSVLDQEYLVSLGKFDFVYSWGVLHHTGDMAKALKNAILPLSDKGVLFIAIYNDQGTISNIWKKVKKTYCSGFFGRILVKSIYIPWFTLLSIGVGIVKHRNPIGNFLNYKRKRGMSIYHDWIDWLGGYPFEVAKPEDIISFYKEKEFVLDKIVTTNRLGCNEFVFRRQKK